MNDSLQVCVGISRNSSVLFERIAQIGRGSLLNPVMCSWAR